MLTGPSNGCCTFSLLNFEMQMSCVMDIPVDWLKTCKFGLEHNAPVSLLISDYGNEYIVLLLQWNKAILIKEIENQKTFEEMETNLLDFAEYLIEDVRKYFAGWINWYSAQIPGEPNDGREEVLNSLLADTETMLIACKKSQKQ